MRKKAASAEDMHLGLARVLGQDQGRAVMIKENRIRSKLKEKKG
jgi:hypothetical protein